MKNTDFDSISPNLFSIKENYVLSCTPTGKLQSMMLLSSSERRKMEHNNMHLMGGITTTDVNGFPILRPFTKNINYPFIPYSQRCQVNPSEFGIHFFEDDYKFRTATWD